MEKNVVFIYNIIIYLIVMEGNQKIKRKIVVKSIIIVIFLLLLGINCIPSYNVTQNRQILDYGITMGYSSKNFQPLISSRSKNQLSFAAFSDTHIGAKYEYPSLEMANHLDKIGDDLVDSTNFLDFAIHLGDIINHNTAQINGIKLHPVVNQYKNNLKAYLISHVNLPFYFVLGNHDINDYQMNKDDPHNLTKSLIDELSMNNPIYSMMRDGILFLIVPELGYVQWTHPVEYEWIEYMTKSYPDTTTIILCHQAIEDTTVSHKPYAYRGKQDMDWWANLFQKNPQIKMWIHGHNHILDWYVGNQSTGETLPVNKFGHEIAFSAPYSQLDWNFDHEEDKIVIYNISSSKITTSTWENNGFGGHWVQDYVHSWTINTTFDSNAEDWYSFPMFLQDNETQFTDMKLLSPNIKLQLVGTTPMELFYDSYMESPYSKPDVNEGILGFGHDRCGNVIWNNPGMTVHGPTYINFPEKYPYSYDKKHEDGRSGQLYHCFPMGTICAAIPNQTYNFTMTARSISGNGRFNMTVNCTDWGTRSQYSVLSHSESQVLSHVFGANYETISGTYTVPDNNKAWFLQGQLNFIDSTDYDVSLFSVKRNRKSDTTDDFHLCLSGTWYNVSGTLNEDEIVNFSVDPQVLSNADGVINFTAFIDGNRYGMVNLVYYEPLLISRNARFKVNSYFDGIFNISLTKTISRSSAVEMRFWNSKIFKMYPLATELISRFLMTGITSRILNFILRGTTSVFKMFPFSTDPIYDKVNIKANDDSDVKHISNNGNIWFTCNSPNKEKRDVEIFLYSC